MQRTIQWLGIAAAVLLLAGCSTTSTVIDFDETHDFSADRTYALYQLKQRPGPEQRVSNDLLDNRIKRALTANLEADGLRQAPAQDADLLVTFHIALERNLHIYNSGWGHPYRWHWGAGPGYAQARLVTRGTLIVDVLDGENRSLVWRGVAEGAFRKPNAKELVVSKVVTQLLAEFPMP